MFKPPTAYFVIVMLITVKILPYLVIMLKITKLLKKSWKIFGYFKRNNYICTQIECFT